METRKAYGQGKAIAKENVRGTRRKDSMEEREWENKR